MIPYVSKEQISELDSLMVERYDISIEEMMKLAAKRLAEFISVAFPEKKHVLFCIGKGNNGGDGLLAAKLLYERGYNLHIFLITKDLDGLPARHLAALEKLNLPITTDLKLLERWALQADFIVDCFLGYGLSGPPRGAFIAAIEAINQATLRQRTPIIACDIPSGVHCDRGRAFEPRVFATHIVSFALPRIGCKDLEAKQYVADIGVPKELYPLIGLEAIDYFKEQSIIKIK